MPNSFSIKGNQLVLLSFICNRLSQSFPVSANEDFSLFQEVLDDNRIDHLEKTSL